MLKDTLLQRQLKILLIGETCIDFYLLGRYANRKYSETKIEGKLHNNVPIFNIKSQYQRMGMAANVKENFINLGHEITFLTNEQPILKKRYVDINTKEHVLRVDAFDECKQLNMSLLKNINFRELDVVVFSDYNKGLITREVMEYVRLNFKGYIFVDSKKTNLEMFDSCILKINESEHKKVVNFPKEYELIVTKGPNGAEHAGVLYAAHSVDNVIDICGAGDNFLAGIAIMYHTTSEFNTSIKFANYCASTCLGSIGVKPITKKEVISYVNGL